MTDTKKTLEALAAIREAAGLLDKTVKEIENFGPLAKSRRSAITCLSKRVKRDAAVIEELKAKNAKLKSENDGLFDCLCLIADYGAAIDRVLIESMSFPREAFDVRLLEALDFLREVRWPNDTKSDVKVSYVEETTYGVSPAEPDDEPVQAETPNGDDHPSDTLKVHIRNDGTFFVSEKDLQRFKAAGIHGFLFDPSESIKSAIDSIFRSR